MKVFVRDIPYPKGSITNDTNLSGSIYPPPFRLFVKPLCKVVSRFYCPDITGRLFIAYRPPFHVEASLGEDAAQLGLSCFCLASIFTAPVGGFPFDHRDSGAIHAYIQPGNRPDRNNVARQGRFSLRTMKYLDLITDHLGYAFHLLGVDTNTGKLLQILMPKTKGAHGTHFAYQPADAWTVTRCDDIEGSIFGAKTRVAFFVVIVRTLDGHLTQYRE